MPIVTRVFPAIQRSLELYCQMRSVPLKGLTMCELGDQLMDVDGIDFKVAKDYWESLGIKHTSIDINGEHGALPLDLSKPICNKIQEIGGPFDIVTNFGTSEHVKDQYQCFRNIHDLCKVPGMVIHSVPAVGHWDNHGLYHYSLSFFEILARQTLFSIAHSDTIVVPGKAKNNVHCAMISSTWQPFIDKDMWHGL